MLRIVNTTGTGSEWPRSHQPTSFFETTYVTTGAMFREGASGTERMPRKFSALQRDILNDLLQQRALPPIPAGALVDPNAHNAHVAVHGAMPAELDANDPRAADFALSPEIRLIGVVGHDMVLDDVWSIIRTGFTRILAAWHQSACRNTFDPLVSRDTDVAYEKALQFYLPFGTEALAPHINACLSQQRFDRALGYHPDDVLGDATRAGNSMDMLRSVAGSAPGTAYAQQTRILLANLPEQSESITGHNDSCRFAALGIMRMAEMADRLWDLNTASAGMRGGYAMDIHLPAALLSADHTSREIMADAIDAINTQRNRRDAPPLRFSIHNPEAAASDDQLFPFTVDLREAGVLT